MKTMWGVEYFYRDQFVHDEWFYPIVFTSKEKAQAYIDVHDNRWYLSIVEMKVDPEPEENK